MVAIDWREIQASLWSAGSIIMRYSYERILCPSFTQIKSAEGDISFETTDNR